MFSEDYRCSLPYLFNIQPFGVWMQGTGHFFLITVYNGQSHCLQIRDKSKLTKVFIMICRKTQLPKVWNYLGSTLGGYSSGKIYTLESDKTTQTHWQPQTNQPEVNSPAGYIHRLSGTKLSTVRTTKDTDKPIDLSLIQHRIKLMQRNTAVKCKPKHGQCSDKPMRYLPFSEMYRIEKPWCLESHSFYIIKKSVRVHNEGPLQDPPAPNTRSGVAWSTYWETHLGEQWAYFRATDPVSLAECQPVWALGKGLLYISGKKCRLRPMQVLAFYCQFPESK